MPMPSLLRRLSSSFKGPSEEIPSSEAAATAKAPPPKASSSQQSGSKGGHGRISEDLNPPMAATEPEAHSELELSYDDIKALFSGAPHFMLDKQNDGRSHPQVIFPWNSELDIADLMDRRLVRHGSFAVSTLHAHLPFCQDVSKLPKLKEYIENEHARKRPAFELGVFEVPNMLYYEGKQPGTVGMRYFLEIPVSDSLRTEEQVKEKCMTKRAYDMAHMTSTEAFKAMKLGDQGMNIGKNAAWRDRYKFVKDRKSWKELGVRNMSVDVINSRMAIVTPWYDKMAREGWRGTILDETNADGLYDELFTLMLFPPRPATASTDRGIGVQIEALINVLSTPGAFLDFSLVDTRLRVGEVLWEVPTKEDTSEPCNPGAQRHWTLVQILLSIELAIRLDASLRDQKVHHSEGINTPEIHLFNRLRNAKIDWDIVMARTFLDNVHVEDHKGAFPPTRPNLGERPSSRLFSKWRQRVEIHEQSPEASSWDFVIIPRDLDTQIEGLLNFAKALNWPNVEEFERVIRTKMRRWSSATSFAERKTFVGPIQKRKLSSDVGETGREQWTRKRKSNEGSLRVDLEPASDAESGGWLSRSWFAGFVLPGEPISHFLISALLEHDPESLKAIGSNADLYGGFSLKGQSWWSKACIVGRVTAPYDGGTECMGWVGTPNIKLLDHSGTPVSDKWFSVGTKPIPHAPTKFRIRSGPAVAEDSNPLGKGNTKVMSLDFSCLQDEPATKASDYVQLQALVLRPTANDDRLVASAKFSITAVGSATHVQIQWELTHDVQFVSAYACRVPHFRAIPPRLLEGCAEHQPTEKLCGHLIHKTFRYTIKRPSDLLDWVPTDSGKTKKDDREVYVIDARGDKAHEVLARAWCSKIGRHALVSKVGRTCLSCSIREANALAISVVIRMGHRG